MTDTIAAEKGSMMKRSVIAAIAALAALLAVPSSLQARYRDGMNLYEYVRSNPCRYVDPSGAKLIIAGGSKFRRCTNKDLATLASLDPRLRMMIRDLRRSQNIHEIVKAQAVVVTEAVPMPNGAISPGIVMMEGITVAPTNGPFENTMPLPNDDQAYAEAISRGTSTRITWSCSAYDPRCEEQWNDQMEQQYGPYGQTMIWSHPDWTMWAFEQWGLDPSAEAIADKRLAILAHELQHAWDMDRGGTPIDPETGAVATLPGVTPAGNPVNVPEVAAVQTQNIVNEALGLPLRPDYSGMPVDYNPDNSPLTEAYILQWGQGGVNDP